jgi:hypothetical protein
LCRERFPGIVVTDTPVEVLDRLRKDARFRLYPTYVDPAGAVPWAGDDLSEFVELAAAAGVDLLYVRESEVDEDEVGAFPELSSHKGESYSVCVSFFRADVWHSFDWAADWAGVLLHAPEGEAPSGSADGPYPRGPTPADWEALGRALATRRAELTTAFLAAAGESDDIPSPDSDESVRAALLTFLGERLDLKSLVPPHGIHNLFLSPTYSACPIPAVEKELRSMVKEIEVGIRKREREIVARLTEKAADWAIQRELGLRAFSVARVREFLGEQSIALSHEGTTELWTRTVAAVKRKRGTTDHH